MHVATYAISQTEMIANICHYGAWHKPADCYVWYGIVGFNVPLDTI